MSDAKIVYGIWNQQEKINSMKHMNMYLKFKGASLYYLHRMNTKLDIISKNSIEEILAHAVENEYDYCVVQAAGAMFKDFNFDEVLRKFISENHFGVAGHVLAWPGRWLELHPQFFIVNIKAYVEVGKPKFGSWADGPLMLPVFERSEENFHDDYTPLWVRATGEQDMQKYAGQGWQLLCAMLKTDWPVITFTEEVKFKNFYTYPEHKTYEFEQSISKLEPYPDQNWNQTKLIKDTLAVKDQVWLFNSENYNFVGDGLYDVVANTASGFKILDIIHNPRINLEKSKIIIYDFNQIALDWYYHFYKFEGDSLLECIRSFSDRDYFTWIGHGDGIYRESDSFFESLNNVFHYFGGEENFIIAWRTFKQLPVYFSEINLYSDQIKFSGFFIESKRCLINLSNIFSTDAATVIFGHNEVISQYYKLLATLFIVNPDIEINANDYWNRFVCGSVKELL